MGFNRENQKFFYFWYDFIIILLRKNVTFIFEFLILFILVDIMKINLK